MALQLFKIASVEVSSPQGSLDFQNIPSGYTDLKVVVSSRTNYSSFLDLNMYFNGNASSGYSYIRLFGDGGTASSNGSSSAGVIPGATLGTAQTANTFASNEFYIPNYTSSNYKSVSADGVTENNSSASYATFTAGLSTLTSAITRITFGLGAGNFVAGTTATLYGVL